MYRSAIGVALGLLVLAPAQAGAAAPALQQHVDYLASDKLSGRLTGSKGAERAGKYLVRELSRLGAVPLPGTTSFKLPFEFTAGMRDSGSTLGLERVDGGKKSWKSTQHIQALSFSESQTVSGPVVFAGYGLTVPEGEDFGYDSFFGLDLTDKIVLVMRYFPEEVDQETRALLARYSGLRYKAMRARELGAKAVLLVTGPNSPNAGETIPMTFDTALSGSGIVAASISSEVAAEIFEAAEGKNLADVQRSLDTGNPHVTGFDIDGLTLTVKTSVARERRQGFNVVGYLPEDGYRENNERKDRGFVVLGAHYDHLGHGRQHNSLARKGEVGEVHHGADDNASGVAAVLEAGSVLSQKARRRPIVLAFWGGEELGLLGSSDFVASEQIKPDAIHAYLNFDMVGRMRENKLTVQALGSSSSWPKIVEQANVVAGFDLHTQDDPYLPTDSTAFYQAGVPTMNFFTGSHEDYHRPTDTADRVNYPDLKRIADFAAVVASKVAGLAQRPDYLKVARARQAGGDRDTLRAFTGTIPDYTTEVNGLQLGGVIEGGPAEQAGLRAGDVIIEFAGQKITNIYDYTYALDTVKIGEPVRVVVQRGSDTVEVEITPTGRK